MYPIAHIRQKSSRSHFKHFEEFFPPRSHQKKWAVQAYPGATDTFCADDYLVRYICFKIYSVYFGTCSRRTRRSRHRVFIYPSHANIRPCVPACAWVALWPYPQILKYTYTRPIGGCGSDERPRKEHKHCTRTRTIHEEVFPPGVATASPRAHTHTRVSRMCREKVYSISRIQHMCVCTGGFILRATTHTQPVLPSYVALARSLWICLLLPYPPYLSFPDRKGT